MCITSRRRQNKPASCAAPSPSAPLAFIAPAMHVRRNGGCEECGCTGIEIEAVTLLVAVAKRIGVERVRTNRCADSCTWPLGATNASQRLVHYLLASQGLYLRALPLERLFGTCNT